MSLYAEKQSFDTPIDAENKLPFAFMGRNANLIPHICIFLTMFGILKLNQFLFFHFDTNPAIILMPVGIALAAVYLWGYRMWFPLTCAWLLNSLMSPAHPPLPVIISISIAYPLQALIGAYILKRLNFLGSLARTRCAIVLITVALTLPAIAPTITTTVQWLCGSLLVPGWTSWTRAWAGGVMSIMLFTPLITTWYRHRTKKTRKEFIESVAAMFSLIVAIYLTFWTKISPEFTFFTLYLLLTILFWVGLRMHPRITATALFLVAALGMAGTIISHPSTTSPLSSQLLANELFIILIAPIFYILTALVEERRRIAREAGARALELEEANHKLSREDDAKNTFLAMLAHELRNPLAPVISSLEMIKIRTNELNRPDIAQLVEIAESHSRTITLLLDDLLDISRISQRKFKLQKENVEINTIVKQAERTFNVLHKHRNHTLSISLPDESVWIEADPLRLEQIIVNLLNNAAKYTNPGGHITLRVTREAGKYLRIRVKDNGIGIDARMIKRIFEKFVQSDENNFGLGIGLWLTKRLTELHGGRIHVQSEGLGKGAEFIVMLPDVQSVTLPLAASMRRLRKGFSSAPKEEPRRTYNILLVDDNEAAADALRKLLEYKGHTVTTAYSGPAAIEKMRTVKAEVILLDIGLPGMNGYEVAKKLRQEYGSSSLTLIALTGYGQEVDKENARMAGFDHHLTKPVGIEDIEGVLSR